MTNTPTILFRRMRPYCSLLVLCVGLGWAPTVHAQRGRGDPDVPVKTSPAFRAAFRDVVAPSLRSTVRVRCDDKAAALGAIVGADGWIVTKASELKGEIVCQLPDGRELPARIVGIQEPYDLAMLKVEAKNLTPVEWRDSTAEHVGNWLATPGMDDAPVAVGVLSVGTRKITGNELRRRSNNGGFLGVRLVASVKKGVKIAEVLRGGAAAKAGFEADDIIIAVGKTPITDPDTLFKALQKTRAGQVVTVRVQRDDEELELKPKLGKRPPDRSDFQNRLGGELSDRRTGFPVVLQHDTVLRPSDCGGPIVDLDGKVIGINIARAGRTESFAIPAEAVKPLLKDLQSGKLAPPK
ncbi:MAG TPA: PDZ domain-containing protein [Gemmataceae bacterium]|nr:PDZ domain-containing protein [Gemmataceae bacterium]